jgi:hypothetical protein
MDGFNPLGGLKGWHVTAGLILAGFGVLALFIMIIMGFIWLFNHVQII